MQQQITAMVEDYWRETIPHVQAGRGDDAHAAAARFEARIEAAAAALPPDQIEAFRERIETERNWMIEEYRADPVALKRRLGLSLGVDHPAGSHGKAIGAAVVRTASGGLWSGALNLLRSLAGT